MSSTPWGTRTCGPRTTSSPRSPSLWARRAGATSAMVKLNEGVAGAGNAVVDLVGLPGPGATDEARALLDRIERMELEGPDRHAWYLLRQVRRAGGIVEERITGVGGAEPQRPAPGDTSRRGAGAVHPRPGARRPDRAVLPGLHVPRGRVTTPGTITEQAELVGVRLAELGVLGRFAIDFVVVRDGAGWRSYAIEINLRKGGTTHPFLTMQFLTNGRYDPDLALFATPAGREKAPDGHGPPGGPEPRRPGRGPPVRPAGAHGAALRPGHPDAVSSCT